MKTILKLIICILPWKIKRFLLVKIYHYDLHPQSRIGFSYIYPKHLIMKKGATIRHLNVGIHLDTIIIGENSTISRENWITGFPTQANSKHFSHQQKERKSELIMGKESAITKKHHIDCTNSIIIGDYVTIAGYSSQFLTHSINVYENRQDSHPILIQDYCFVSTGVTILGGSILPAYSVLGAGAVLNKPQKEEWKLYGGIPAKIIKDIPQTAKYFSRKRGFVY